MFFKLSRRTISYSFIIDYPIFYYFEHRRYIFFNILFLHVVMSIYFTIIRNIHNYGILLYGSVIYIFMFLCYYIVG